MCLPLEYRIVVQDIRDASTHTLEPDVHSRGVWYTAETEPRTSTPVSGVRLEQSMSARGRFLSRKRGREDTGLRSNPTLGDTSGAAGWVQVSGGDSRLISHSLFAGS